MLFDNLLIASGMMIGTICVHFFGLAGLIAILRAEVPVRWRKGSALEKGASLLMVVFGLVFLHSLDIWAYAALYLSLGEFHELETSLYFSTSSFTTLGIGDVVVSHGRRLIAAIESANGFLLIGWSTAFLVSVTARMGLLEAQLASHGDAGGVKRPDSP
ncbi:MAG TPA: ion channel [Hyphomonadaceae bacterium]|nr:ion channel [Hyphomonadaceae bacterium]